MEKVGGRFLVKQWADGCVVFDSQFGDTHALDPASAAVFLSLKKGDREQAALLATLSPFCPEETKLNMASRLDALLEQLTMLGLLEANTN